MKKLKAIAILLLLAFLTVALTGCVVTVPVPEIKEGRFDFSVTYEIDGEEKTYSGVYVCCYDGVLTTFLGSYVEWRDYVENEGDKDIVIQTNADGVVYLSLGFVPEYFMNKDESNYSDPMPGLYMVYNDSEPDMFHITSDEEEIAEYGVRLISCEYDDPIVNTFNTEIAFSRFEPTIN